jgi:hypothetical protein
MENSCQPSAICHAAPLFPLLEIEIERKSNGGRDKGRENKEDKDALPETDSALA